MVAFLTIALKGKSKMILIGVMLAIMLTMAIAPAFASTTIEIDTAVMFASVNDWISTFIGPLSIGIGIAIALALITFIGSQIIGAFRSTGRR